MAEPLSTISAAVSLVLMAAEISAQIFRLKREWKDAPAQIQSLSEEIDLSHHVAMELRALCKQLGQPQASGNLGAVSTAISTAIQTQIKRTTPVWTELEKILQSVQGPLRSKIRRDKWIVNANRVDALRAQLREIRASTNDILNIYAASRSVYIESLVATCNRDIVALRDEWIISFQEIKSKLDGSKTPQRPVSDDDVSLVSKQAITLTAESSQPETSPLAFIKLGPKQNNFCKRLCHCQCHSRRTSRFRIAPFRSILGSLSVVYAGFAFAGQSCDIRSCHNFGERMIEITYSFPQWTFNICAVGGLRVFLDFPTAGLTLQRRITKDIQSSSILDVSRFANAAELRDFLQKYPSSVNDIDARNGSTALDYASANNYAVSNQKYENVGIMLAFGADPFITDDYGRSAAVVELILLSAQKCKPPIMQDHLPSKSDFDNYNLSHLTKVILGFRPLDLQTELSKAKFRNIINEKDLTGLTPLHWAVAMSDSLAVEQLLQAGADPEILDPWKYTAINRACRQRSGASCVEALLMAGARLTSRSYYGQLPIHHAAAAGQSNRVLSMLIAHGLDSQDSATVYRDTPLALAAINNRDETCRFLLAQGVDVNSKDWEGGTPLHEAIRGRSHRALSVLLSAGADCLSIDDNGHTILHYIAERGDKATIAIISESNLRGIDVEAKDSLGQTAQDYLQRRVNVENGFKHAFNQLVEQIRCANSSPLNEVNSDEDCFVDALENLNFNHGIGPGVVS